jgi:hypothetical protein
MLNRHQAGTGAIENKFLSLPKVRKPPKGREWTYFLRADCEARLLKIGNSVHLKWRLTGLQTQCPVQLSLVGLVQAPAGTEFVLHEALSESRAHGEWFRPTPAVERIRRALPKAESIETPDLIRLVEPLGVSKDRVLELLLRALTRRVHSDVVQDQGAERFYGTRLEQMTSPRFRNMLRELSWD